MDEPKRKAGRPKIGGKVQSNIGEAELAKVREIAAENGVDEAAVVRAFVQMALDCPLCTKKRAAMNGAKAQA